MHGAGLTLKNLSDKDMYYAGSVFADGKLTITGAKDTDLLHR
ncbi:hypothetical protein EVA_21919 [gut metagenome]|uniref:Uncharacterized protein n=1 Tax=gut metagenome TaxID=749906 RepID=J9FRG1_9ZZZZ